MLRIDVSTGLFPAPARPEKAWKWVCTPREAWWGNLELGQETSLRIVQVASPSFSAEEQGIAVSSKRPSCFSFK